MARAPSPRRAVGFYAIEVGDDLALSRHHVIASTLLGLLGRDRRGRAAPLVQGACSSRSLSSCRSAHGSGDGVAGAAKFVSPFTGIVHAVDETLAAPDEHRLISIACELADGGPTRWTR